MKYIVSLMFVGVLLISTLSAQNTVKNKSYVLDQVSVATSPAEEKVTEVSSREQFIMENSMNDYSSTTWSRDVYRQIGNNIEGNETFFYPPQSTETRVNLFSTLINLLTQNAVVAYKYEDQPDLSGKNILEIKDLLKDNKIPYIENEDNTVTVKKEDIPSSKITHYLVKEKWFYDVKSGKGDVRVTDICPVLYENGKYYPMFWIPFDDVSPYLARAVSPVSVDNISPVLSNASIFDIISNRYYRGCIYQVGLRQLSDYFPDMKDLIAERMRIENELDYIQSKFYAIERRR